VVILVSDYMAIVDNKNIFAICRLIDKRNLKEFKGSFEMEVFANLERTRTKIVQYTKVEEVLIRHTFDYIYVTDVDLENLDKNDIKYLKNELGYDLNKIEKLYLGIDPNVLLDVWIIIKLLTYYGIYDIHYEIENMTWHKAFEELRYFAPVKGIAPIILQDKLYPTFFAIVAPKFEYKLKGGVVDEKD